MQSTIYSAEDEQELMARLWAPAIKDNPLAFVMFAFPWGQPGTPLEHFKGPRKWQREVLQTIADHIKDNQGKIDFNTLRHAVSSGRGIGKSALVSWITIWMLTTRIGSTTIISANSESQLRSVTWAEITKWLAMALNSHWFEVSATRLMPAKWLTELVERDLKKGTRYWGVEGRLWSAENPDAYAGVHNFDGVLVVFDEASGIDDSIWAVTSGFFTENTPNRFWMAFSNPRRNTGYFYEAFNSKREFWTTKVVDARTVEGTDKQVYQQIIDEYGADSSQAHVEVYGQFPSEGDDQFISASLVDEAMKRPKYQDQSAPIVIGVDPARFGADATVIAVRQGRDIISIQRHRGDDTMTVVGHVIEAIEEYKPALVVIDEGGLGAGIVDRLKEQRYKVKGINFGNKSTNPIMYGNKRAEMWGKMKDWLKTASIPLDRFLKTDLISPMMKPDSKGTIFLESKKDMKARGLASPDAADAICVTFAFPVAHREAREPTQRRAYSDRSVATTSWMGS
ncbi:MAG: terminase [Terrimicrobiaceae bacterium]